MAGAEGRKKGRPLRIGPHLVARRVCFCWNVLGVVFSRRILSLDGPTFSGTQ